ncbi:hypothetical protein ICE98_02744 [Lactococcus lactis]|nr:hypothetical protein [Lactococcus lactis]
MIYVGMMPLGLAILFFFTKSIRLRSKFAFLGIIAFFVASFYLQALDLLWQGMHSPNMFLHRYAFYSACSSIMALETLSRWEEIKTWHILTISLFLILGFLSTLVFDHYKYVMTSQVMLTFLFGLAYLFYLLILLGNGFQLTYLSFFSLFS